MVPQYHKTMSLELTGMSDAVIAILRLDGEGNRFIPLTAGACSSDDARRMLSRATAEGLFPGSRSPQGALAGLWVYFSAFEPAHQVAQDLPTKEGSYWHAIVHRMEPDAWNSQYWFNRVGDHPVYAALSEASSIAPWRPGALIELCESARRCPGSADEQRALELQLVEWQLLFSYCAGRATMK